MGRSPKVEPAENERPNAAAQIPQTFDSPMPAPPTQPAAARPTDHHEPARPSSPRAVSETEALARDLKEGVVSGFVGTGTVLTGDADFKGMLRVDGHVSGRITSDKGTLIVSAGGRVDANVRVGTAKVNGIVNGDIIATERLELGRSAQVRGNIQTPTLVVEQGAIFEGGCRMTQGEAAKTQTGPERTAAAPPRPTQPLKPRLPVPATTPPATTKAHVAAAEVAGNTTQAEPSKAVS
jgi:cytoskeletal protein CcmA (bactofilin family)